MKSLCTERRRRLAHVGLLLPLSLSRRTMSKPIGLTEAESAILQAGLVELSRAKPHNPTWWLGMWLKENNPQAVARAEGEARPDEPTYALPQLSEEGASA